MEDEGFSLKLLPPIIAKKYRKSSQSVLTTLYDYCPVVLGSLIMPFINYPIFYGNYFQ